MSTVSHPDHSDQNPASDPTPTDLSVLALTHDGRAFASVQDAAGRDLRGRRVVVFIELTREERARALNVIDDGCSFVASSVVGKLPLLKGPAS
jgi:hypothetical protein